MDQRQLVLSSSSPARRALLERLLVPYSVLSPDLDETPLANETAEALTHRLAIAKAKAGAAQHPQALIIGADQVGALDNHILSKPLTRENAIKQLEHVSGRTVRFFTGLCLLDAISQQYECTVETYDVAFRMLTRTEIESYLDKEDALNCAGSFQAEALGITLIHHFQGSDYTSLIGLPMIRLVAMLKSMGFNII